MNAEWDARTRARGTMLVPSLVHFRKHSLSFGPALVQSLSSLLPEPTLGRILRAFVGGGWVAGLVVCVDVRPAAKLARGRYIYIYICSCMFCHKIGEILFYGATLLYALMNSCASYREVDTRVSCVRVC